MKNNRDCEECICPNCDNFQTENCLEWPVLCEECEAGYRTGRCCWDTNEEEDDGQN